VKKYEIIQDGMVLYKELLDEKATSVVLGHALHQLRTQGYPVKKGTCYAHWNYMWGVNDRGNDFFPVFGKHLRTCKQTTGFGKNLKKIDLPKLEIEQGSNKKWYEYYKTDQHGKDLADIPTEVREMMSSLLGVNMNKFDCALLNFYEENTFLSRHIDNTEDVTAGSIPIVSLNLFGKGKFFYSKPCSDPNHFLPDENWVELGPGDVLVFGGKSRYVSHRVETGFSENVLRERCSNRTQVDIGRINITFRRAAKI
jgi:alkylated DNA repair dioxygenase AlkB